MGGRVVEGTGLENRKTRKRFEGSNPSPSPILLYNYMSYNPFFLRYTTYLPTKFCSLGPFQRTMRNGQGGCTPCPPLGSRTVQGGPHAHYAQVDGLACV